MGLTLIEASKLAQNPVESAIIEEFALGQLLGRMPFENIDGTGKHYNREDTLPGIGFRGLNEGFENSVGVINPESERLVFAGGELDVDKAIVDLQGPAARSAHTMMKVKALRLSIERTIIKGDSTTNPREFDGLQRRIVSGGTQFIANAANGGPLSMLALDELIDAVDATGGQKVLIMNKTMRRRLSQIMKDTSVSGDISMAVDDFGRQVTQYNGLPILEVDYDNNNTQIMGFTEVQGNSSVCTSIYCLALGDLLCTMLQGRCSGQYGISTSDLGVLQTAPVYRTRVEWNIGMAIYNGRAAARLAGITNAKPAA